MAFFLDTSIVVAAFDTNNRHIIDAIMGTHAEYIKIPSVTLAELIHGAHKCNNFERRMNDITNFVKPYEIIPFDALASSVYGKIKAELEAKGRAIGCNDLLIAATAMSRGGILVTCDKGFSHVKGLHTDDWSE
ncbi:MAG: type II toxin-antitoxin system VapC family toxin [Methanomassiliicoccaceae archaeon]|jgi:tRNA(fMet)-specific endonuclease VapC|nr:type II toxin-antitoxin system VapC family toxin [Methanomassiliicoccaceae archaeon]